MPAGTWEAKNLDATIEAARAAFSFQFGEASGFYTVESPAGDVLVAEWGNNDPLRRVWLWDDPRSITFIFAGEPSLIEPGNLASFCERTIRWQDDSGIVKSLELGVLPSGDVVGNAVYPTNEIGALAWWLSTASVRGVGYLAIGMTKAFFGSTYPLGTLRVSERFPPLSSRLKIVGRAALFDEIGKGYKAPAMITYPGSRDEIVLEELTSRGSLSEPEISRIVLGDARFTFHVDRTVDIRFLSLHS